MYLTVSYQVEVVGEVAIFTPLSFITYLVEINRKSIKQWMVCRKWWESTCWRGGKKNVLSPISQYHVSTGYDWWQKVLVQTAMTTLLHGNESC